MSLVKDSDTFRTEITTIQLTLESIEKYTKQIPDMSEKVSRLDEQVKHIRNQVEKLEDRVNKQIEDGHDCKQETAIIRIIQELTLSNQKIETGIQNEIRNKEQLNAAKDEVTEIIQERKSRSSTVTGVLVSLAFFIASTVGGGIWFIGNLNAQVEANKNDLENQIQLIEKHIKTSPVEHPELNVSATVPFVAKRTN